MTHGEFIKTPNNYTQADQEQRPTFQERRRAVIHIANARVAPQDGVPPAHR